MAGIIKDQKLVITRHFRAASLDWDQRYRRRPRKLSDLDLCLRRETVQEIVRERIARSAERRLDVLDLGCGTGNVLDGLSRDRIAVLGMDLVPEMVAAAARAHPQDRFVVADATAIPLAPGCVDLVTCLGMLEYAPEPESVLASIHRVLRPGGHLVLSVPNRRSCLRKISNLEIRVENALFRTLGAISGRRRDLSAPEYRHAQWKLSQVQRMLEAAGLAIEMARLHTYGLWGRVGQSRANLALCRWMTRHFHNPGVISKNLAFTLVIWARKSGNSLF